MSNLQYRFMGDTATLLAFAKQQYKVTESTGPYGIGVFSCTWQGEPCSYINFSSLKARLDKLVKDETFTSLILSKMLPIQPMSYIVAKTLLEESGQFMPLQSWLETYETF